MIWLNPKTNPPDEGDEIIAYKDGVAISGTFYKARRGFLKYNVCSNQYISVEDFTHYSKMKHPRQ